MKPNYTLSDIPTAELYEGYLWMSNQPRPIVLRNEALAGHLPQGANPFIVEGQLYDSTNKKSYSIRFVDGEYLVHCFDVGELEQLAPEQITRKSYLPNRIDKVSTLEFIEVWRPQKDEFCQKMEVLQPAEIVFVGFKSKED